MDIQTRTRTRQVDTSSDEPPSLEPNGAVAYVHTNRTLYGDIARYMGGVEQETTDTIRVPVFTNHPARVRVSGSVTRNLGDYNSAKVEVSIDMPCLPEATEVDRVYHLVSQMVDETVRRELAVATGVST